MSHLAFDSVAYRRDLCRLCKDGFKPIQMGPLNIPDNRAKGLDFLAVILIDTPRRDLGAFLLAASRARPMLGVVEPAKTPSQRESDLGFTHQPSAIRNQPFLNHELPEWARMIQGLSSMDFDSMNGCHPSEINH